MSDAHSVILDGYQIEPRFVRLYCAQAPQHPIIRSLEPGEDWCYCFIDDVGMLIPQVTGHTRIPPSPMLS